MSNSMLQFSFKIYKISSLHRNFHIDQGLWWINFAPMTIYRMMTASSSQRSGSPSPLVHLSGPTTALKLAVSVPCRGYKATPRVSSIGFGPTLPIHDYYHWTRPDAVGLRNHFLRTWLHSFYLMQEAVCSSLFLEAFTWTCSLTVFFWSSHIYLKLTSNIFQLQKLIHNFFFLQNIRIQLSSSYCFNIILMKSPDVEE